MISSIKEYLNLKKSKPHEMLRIAKEDMSLVCGKNALSLNALAFYGRIFQATKIKLSRERLSFCDRIGAFSHISFFEKPFFGAFCPPVVRTLNYLEKQFKPRFKDDCRVSVDYLRDYWNMVLAVYGSLPQELLYPKDLRHAHDRMLLLQKEKVDSKINAGIICVAKKMEYLSFCDEETGLMIRPCESHEELIKEGKFLHHCVGTYASRYSKGQTCILLIRRREEPEIPFFTLEYKDGRVIQNRGANNCNRTENVQKFEEKWKEFIEHGKAGSRGRVRAGA